MFHDNLFLRTTLKTYANVRVQIQFSDIKTMIMDGFLHIPNHQNHIFLQSEREFTPVHFINTIRHLHVTIGGHFSKKAIRKENRHPELYAKYQIHECNVVVGF